MSVCLYCDEVATSEEHPLSAALGEFRDGPVLLNRICKRCNTERIGLLDEQFVRCGPVPVLRKRFNISGRKHHKEVNPFYRGSAGAPPTRVFAWDESLGCEVLVEMKGGAEARQLTQFIIQDGTGKVHHIPLTPSVTAELLLERMRSLELAPPLGVQLIRDIANEQWADDLFKKLWPSEQIPASREAAKSYKGAVVEIEVTNRYYRAIAKTGFHYFLTQFPDYTGREAFLDDLREFIINDSKTISPARINQFVQVHGSPIAPASTGFVAHLLCAEVRNVCAEVRNVCAEVRNGTCLAHFQPFITPLGTLQALQVHLGVDETRQDKIFRAHAYLYYGSGNVGRFAGDALAVDPRSLTLSASQVGAIDENAGDKRPQRPPAPRKQ